MRAHELEAKLKTLRLGGMLQTLDVRRAQAEAERLGHVEFLALLLDDEIDRRQSKMLAERLHRARFEEPKTLADFDFSFNPQIPAEQLRNLASLYDIAAMCISTRIEEIQGLDWSVVPKDKRRKRLAVMDMDGGNFKPLGGGESLVVTPRFSPTAMLANEKIASFEPSVGTTSTAGSTRTPKRRSIQPPIASRRSGSPTARG